MSLEKIVRPFQLGDVFNARKVAPRDQAPIEEQEDVEVEWGGTISSNYNRWQITNTLVGGVSKFSEKSRVTSTQRIENPSDPTQFVDVERIEKLTLASTDGKEIDFTLNG